MSFGKKIPQWHRDLCFVTGANRIVIVAKVTERHAGNVVGKIIQQEQVKGKLANQLAHRYR
jgi:hypothetical protein